MDLAAARIELTSAHRDYIDDPTWPGHGEGPAADLAVSHLAVDILRAADPDDLVEGTSLVNQAALTWLAAR